MWFCSVDPKEKEKKRKGDLSWFATRTSRLKRRRIEFVYIGFTHQGVRTYVRTGLPAGLYYKPIDVPQSSPQSKPKVTELTTQKRRWVDAMQAEGSIANLRSDSHISGHKQIFVCTNFFKTELEGRRLLSVRGRLFIYFFQQAKCTDYVPIFPSLPAANTVVKPTLTLVADAAVTNFVFPGSSCRRGETENERGVHDEAGCGAK